MSKGRCIFTVGMVCRSKNEDDASLEIYGVCVNDQVHGFVTYVIENINSENVCYCISMLEEYEELFCYDRVDIERLFEITKSSVGGCRKTWNKIYQNKIIKMCVFVPAYQDKDIIKLYAYCGYDITIIEDDIDRVIQEDYLILFVKQFCTMLVDIYVKSDFMEQYNVRKYLVELYGLEKYQMNFTPTKISIGIVSDEFNREDRSFNDYYYQTIDGCVLDFIRNKISKYSHSCYDNFHKDFDRIYNYYKYELGKDTNIYAYKESINEEVRKKLTMPFYDKVGQMTNSFVSFSTGGIHGSQFHYEKYSIENVGEDFNVLEFIKEESGIKGYNRYPYVCKGEFIHSDFNSFYPNLLIHCGDLDEVGHINLRRLVNDKNRCSGKERDVIKLLVNSITGAMTSSHYNIDKYKNKHRPTTLLNIRIIGQFITWFICNELVLMGCEVVSMNTDGFYWRVIDGDIKSIVEKINEYSSWFGLSLKHVFDFKMASRNSNSRYIVYNNDCVDVAGNGIKGCFYERFESIPSGLIILEKVCGELLKRNLEGEVLSPSKLYFIKEELGSFERLVCLKKSIERLSDKDCSRIVDVLLEYQIIESKMLMHGRSYVRLFICKGDCNDDFYNRKYRRYFNDGCCLVRVDSLVDLSFDGLVELVKMIDLDSYCNYIFYEYVCKWSNDSVMMYQKNGGHFFDAVGNELSVPIVNEGGYYHMNQLFVDCYRMFDEKLILYSDNGVMVEFVELDRNHRASIILDYVLKYNNSLRVMHKEKDAGSKRFYFGNHRYGDVLHYLIWGYCSKNSFVPVYFHFEKREEMFFYSQKCIGVYRSISRSFDLIKDIYILSLMEFYCFVFMYFIDCIDGSALSESNKSFCSISLFEIVKSQGCVGSIEDYVRVINTSSNSYSLKNHARACIVFLLVKELYVKSK